ncbi:response regulator [Glaciecola sp. MH2013]|uniref:hybrid sensor histidine kinase/response regulator n=1 Tax=Glaciecola sp. MH2013 TaxID=2785524 RepID=UPI00189E8BC7|nr:hybrid sensor histidine kinase/response regulator [Glaciecola sp. MH2013]MBF7073641.1 response regulator [Glaciecola sp. MH2013]
MLCLLLLLSCSNLRASEFQHEHLNENDGFSSSIIFSIEQDQHGFLWFGTAYEGILRYDGKNVVAYTNNPSDVESIPHDNAGNLYLTSDGDIWVGSFGGGSILFDYDNQSFKQYSHVADDPTTISATRVQSIFEDRNGTLWFGTYSNGLNRFNKEDDNFTRYPFVSGLKQIKTKESLSSERVWDIAEAANDGIWLGTSNGLNLLDTKTNEFSQYYPFPDSELPGRNRIRKIHVVNENLLFLGTQEGVMRFDKTLGTFYQLPVEGLDSIGPIYSIIKTSFGDYWVTTDNGVYSFNENRLSLNKVTLDFDDSCSQTLFQDRQETIWLTCEGGGIYKITKADIFSSFIHPEVRSAFALHQSDDNAILIGTYQNGLQKWIPETKTLLALTEGKVGAMQLDIRFITQASNGQIWFSNNERLFYLNDDGETVEFVENTNNVEELKKIRHLNVDANDNIWVSVENGMLKINSKNKQSRFFPIGDIVSDSDSQSSASLSFVDSNKHFWVSVDNQLYLFDPSTESFSLLAYSDSYAERSDDYNFVYSMFQDKNSTLWLANKIGLYTANLETGDRSLVSDYFNEKNNRGIRFISQDSEGVLWLVTPVGVSRFDPKNNKLYHFDHRDGLPGSRYFYNPTSRASDNSIYLSTRDGIFYFDPKTVKVPRPDELMRLTSFEVLGSTTHFNVNELMQAPLQLDYFQNNIKLEFATLDLLNARQIQYEYKLEGFDSDWIDNGTANSATYTNLSGGDYVFRVRARLKQKLWYENELAININVATPFWQKWWMLLVYSLLILLFVLIYIQRQKRAVIELERQVAEKTADIALESQKLAAANRIKTQFLANMSHEIRTPLTTVIGQAEAIICRDINPDDIYKEVEIIHDSSLYLLALLNDILDLTKIEENKFQLEYAPQDLNSLLSNINTMFSMQARVKGLSFSLDEDLPQPFIVIVDGLRLKQILINLLSNALKFTLNGHVALKVEMSKEQLIFHVEDTGIGISKEQVEQIFGSFTQGDASIRRRFGGSGLGLHLSNQLASLMEGEISVSSELGAGSTFTFTMPMPEIAVTPELPQGKLDLDTVSAKSLFNGKILLAEDHEDNRRLISRLLTKLGLTVFTAKDGFEAIEHYKKHQPAVVLLDIQMPRMDGIQAYSELRKLGCEKPIIALTANAMANEVEEYFNLGFDGYIQKPIDRKSLISTIATFFESKDDHSMSRANSVLGNVDMSDLVTEFTQGLQQEWDQFEAFVKANDIQGIRAQAHRLSGAAQLFGFADLSAKATQLENNIKQGNADMTNIQADLSALKQSIERCFH